MRPITDIQAPMRSHRRNGIVFGAAVGLVGVTFGVLSRTAGLGLAKTMAMSMLVFTGASQFAAVSVIDGGGSPISAVGSALLLGARNGLYGMRLSPLLARIGWRRVPAAQLVIDESTAFAVNQRDDRSALEAFFATGLAVFVFWNLGTLAGVQLGAVIGDPESWGLDAAFPASFVALLGPQLATRPGRVAAIAGAAIAVAAVPLTPAGAPILLAALGVIPALMVRRSVEP